MTGGAEPALWDGRGVTISEVLAQLAELRVDPDGDAPLSLAGVLNLVAVAPGDHADVAEVEKVLGHLADHQPSRAVLVQIGGEGEGIDAHVSSSCSLGSGTSVCFEKVVLTMRGDALKGAASAVVPLLRPELPSFLWWPASPAPDDPLLESLSGLAGRLVTETARDRDDAEGLQALGGAVEAGGPAVTDLAWAAVTPWRQLMAQILRPGDLDALRSGATMAAVSHGSTEPSVKALLVAGWLRDVVGPGLWVELHARPGNTGRIEGITIESTTGLSFAVERVEDRRAVALTVSRSGRATGRRVLPLGAPIRSYLLAGELELQGPDPSFEGAVHSALELAAA